MRFNTSQQNASPHTRSLGFLAGVSSV